MVTSKTSIQRLGSVASCVLVMCKLAASLCVGDLKTLIQDVVCGSLPGQAACVRCPRHHTKFGGGLWYNLQTGESLTLGETSHHAPIYRVGAFSVKEDGGRVFVSKSASSKSPALRLSEKINIRVHKVARAMGCSCVSANSASNMPDYRGGWAQWSVVKVDKVPQDCLIIRLAGSPQSSELTNQHLWHVSLRMEVQGQLVERDYTPISSLAEHESGTITLWIRVYADGTLTPALEAFLQPSCGSKGGVPVPPLPSGVLGKLENADNADGCSLARPLDGIQLQVLSRALRPVLYHRTL